MTNHKRDVLIFGLLLILCALTAHSQTQSFGPYSITGTQCATVPVDRNATVAFQIIGSTWTGTIQPNVATAGQSAVAVQVTPVASSTKQTTIIVNGAYFANVAGFTVFKLCGASVTNTATVFVNISPYLR
jgi:hypothetical protein